MKVNPSFLLSLRAECRVSEPRKGFRKVRKIQIGSLSSGYQLMQVGGFVKLSDRLKSTGGVEIECQRIGKVNLGNT